MRVQLMFEIDDKLEKQFSAALKINNENGKTVLVRMLREYIKTAKAKRFGEDSPKVEAFSTALRKIPKWAHSPTQTNHRVVRAFFRCEQNGKASRTQMMLAFMDEDHEPRAEYRFSSTFASLCTNSPRGNGRVFFVLGDDVILNKAAEPLLLQYKDLFLRGATLGVSFKVEPPPVVELTTDEIQRADFMKWMSAQRTLKGHRYNTNTVLAYSMWLANACRNPIFDEIKASNIFTIRTKNKLTRLRKKLVACPGYVDYNLDSHGVFDLALRKYHEFLHAQANGWTPSDTDLPTPE